MVFTPNNKGFTLLEVLLAITIFAIVLGSVYSAYRTTFSTVSAATDSLKNTSQGQKALEIMINDLSALCQNNQEIFIASSTYSGGLSGIELSFITSNPTVMNPYILPSATTEISYTSEIDEETGLLNLYRTVSPAQISEETSDQSENSTKWLLCGNLHAVRFTYLSAENEELEEWDVSGEESAEEMEDNMYPIMVRLTLEFAASSDTEQPQILQTAVAILTGEE